MKLEYKSSKILLTFFFIAFFVVILPNVSEAANRYWVGGGSSVNWNATVPTNWGTASNTQDDASVPGAGDDVFFDGVGTGASNSTLSASITVNSLDMTGYANTLTHNTAVTVTIDSQNVNGDSLLMVAGMTYVTGSLTTSAFSFTGIGTNDITTGGKILGNVTFSNTGDTFRLLDGLNTTGNFSLSAGIFDANLQTVTMSGADQTITPTAALTFYNLTRTGTATKLDVLTLAGNITVTNILTLAGNSSTNRLLVESSVLGTTRTITNTGATMTWSNVDFVDIDLSTAYDCSAITGLCGDAGGNTDITFTTADENFWIGDTGNWNDAAEWSTSSGGAANGRVPLPQDDATFDANSFSTTGFTVTSNMPRSGKNIDFSAVGTDNPTWTVPNEGYNNIIYGSLTLDSGMTVAGSNGRVFQGRGAFTLTNAGVTYARAITVQMVGGTLTLLDAYDSASTIIFSNGTFDANDFNVTGSGISISGSATKVVTMGSGTWTATSVSTAWGWSTSGTTLNEETSTIVISNTTATAKTFAGAGETYNNLTITGDDVTITGNNTFNILALNNPTEEEGLIIGTGSTQTVSSITTTASSGNVVLLSGVAGGGAETISDASGTNCLDYLTITNVTVSGGATFHAGSHSTDGGGNSGWLFTDCDTTPPTITNVSSDKANGSYTTGEVIDIDVTFSEEVTSTGNVTVTLETGTTDQTCTFTVTAATTGTCNYTVVSGDTSADLTVSTISGTINDAAGNAMTNFVPTTNLAANKDIVIDTTAPSAPGTPDMTAGTDSGTSSTDDITSDTTPDFTMSCETGATVTLYDNVTSVGTGVCSSSTVTITSSALSLGTHATMNAKQTDVALNVSSASSNLSVTIDTTPPTITNVSSDKANGSYTTGEVIDIDVTFSEEVTSTGNVTVTLETGTTDQTCTFTVTAATTGTCNYTVVSGDTSADLTVSTISGTINDAAGNAMTNFVPTTNLAANKDIVIIVVTAPTLTTSAASSVADTTATLNGDITATGGANATARGFEYGTTISYGTSTTSSGSYGIASFSDNITSLTCATTYHFRSYATNSAGTGSGADATFTTTSCPSSGGGGGGNSGLGGGGGGGTIIVNAPTVVEIIENPIDFIDNQIITPIFTTIDKIIPSFLKPKPVPVKPIVPVEELVTEKVPLALGGIWQLYLLPQKAEFVLAPLPKAINDLAQKFPTLEQTFNEVGISKITDITKLNNIKLNLPGLTERVGLSTLNIKPSIFSLPEGIPIGNLSLATKKQIPAEIIFVKTGAELIDFNPTLSVSDKGEPEQKINTISGKLLQLAVKPDKPVESVKGYVVFKSRAIRSTSLEIPSDSLLASAIFATPVFAQIEEKPVRVEEKLVLLEFLYTDIDGDGIYTAEIKAPLVEGEYEIITVLDFIDPDLGNKQIRLTTVVDPEGYVYSTLPAGKLRIAGAVVSIYWLNPGTKKYEIWSAKEYQQENPQVTDDTGKYSFLVPPGTYYLRIEHPNYPAYQSETFVVKEGSGVHMNIELKTKYWWLQIFDWKTTLLVLVIILLLYNFYRDKMRESLMK